jgi:5'(3')-deoxyribonucleotidase
MSENKPLVALDCDEVLFDFARPYLRWREDRGLLSARMDQLTGYHWHDLLGVDPATANEQEAQFLQEVSADLPPIDGAVRGVAQLSKSFDLVVLTARVESAHGELTRFWIDKYFPGMFRQVILTHIDPMTSTGRKSEHVERIGAAVLVDDYAGHLSTLGPARRGVLFGTHPWVKASSTPAGSVRVEHWGQLPDVLTSLVSHPAGRQG